MEENSGGSVPLGGPSFGKRSWNDALALKAGAPEWTFKNESNEK